MIKLKRRLMRRAGYEVRVMPVEGGSYEENPPDALAFIGRDVRWCQGNMQYLKLLNLPGLMPVSRFQLVWAILMFLGIPAWTLMIAALPFATLDALRATGVSSGVRQGAVCGVSADVSEPKNCRPDGCRDDAAAKFSASAACCALRSAAAIEIVFSFLQGAVTTIRTSLFMLGLAVWQIDCLERTAA